jgi:hypothetical protein
MIAKSCFLQPSRVFSAKPANAEFRQIAGLFRGVRAPDKNVGAFDKDVGVGPVSAPDLRGLRGIR